MAPLFPATGLLYAHRRLLSAQDDELTFKGDRNGLFADGNAVLIFTLYIPDLGDVAQ
jgi:hypothetical protein